MKTPLAIQNDLLALADNEYRAFQSKLIPTVPYEKVLGVRMPALRAYAKHLSQGESEAFLSSLPHTYYDEDNLHGILLCLFRDFDGLISHLEAFLPYIDNWATCDMLRPKLFKTHTRELYPYIETWLASPHLYTARFAIGLLLSFYLGDAFLPEHLAAVAALSWEEYYIQMMQAWYFATALAYHWEETLPYLAEHRLSPAVHRMTIRKACESFRITKEQKDILRAL